jgi:cytochrome c nitrite reductase small subunit
MSSDAGSKNPDPQPADPNNPDPTPAGSDAAASIAPATATPARSLWPRYAVGAFAVGLGVLAGIGTFTFGYGKGAGYLSNNPVGCANCHVMQDHFDSWQHSSHHHVAVCNDCHLPHNFVGKWAVKAEDGLVHSAKFTFENYHEPIQIRPHNSRVTQNTCIHCHKDFVHALLPPEVEAGEKIAGHETLSCVHCHKNVGHAYRSP